MMRSRDIAEQFSKYQRRLADNGEITHRKPATENVPLLTIITPVLNQRAAVAQALDSVRAQTCHAIEHIVVDGGSVDGTYELLWERREDIDILIRGTDKGPSDAINKGLVQCRGAFICCLYSDDVWDSDYVTNSLAALRRPRADFVYGDIVAVRPGRAGLLVKGESNYTPSIRYNAPRLNYCTLMFARHCLDAVGLWNPMLYYSSDYDWILRCHLAGLRGQYDPSIRMFFGTSGISSRHPIAAQLEVRGVALSHGGAWPLVNLAFLRNICSQLSRAILALLLPDAWFYFLLEKYGRSGTRRHDDGPTN
jgi:glycosyltransferase involved in cell wall biosynthesis